MIEVERVEPKKIQRKLLTAEQIKSICDENTKTDSDGCMFCNRECPLKRMIGNTRYCVSDIKELEQEIKDYWNEEIEIGGE